MIIPLHVYVLVSYILIPISYFGIDVGVIWFCGDFFMQLKWIMFSWIHSIMTQKAIEEWWTLCQLRNFYEKHITTGL